MKTVKIAENTGRKARSAFTLVELLVVIIIIVMLMSLVYSVIINTRSRHKLMQVKADVTGLEVALKSYRNTYNGWPKQGGEQHDKLYIADNGVIVDILTGNPNSVNDNPRRIRFFEDIQGSWTNNGATYVDPWGKPYMIAFDNDNDRRIDVPEFTVTFPYGGEDTRYITFSVEQPMGVVAMSGTNFFVPVETVPGSGVYRPGTRFTISDNAPGDAYLSWKLLSQDFE